MNAITGEQLVVAFFASSDNLIMQINFCCGASINFDWEQRKLKDMLLVHSGKDYKSLKKGNIPVFGTGGYITSVSKSLSSQNAIGLGRKGTINKPYILKAPFWTVDTLFFLTVKNGNKLDYLLSVIQRINWLKYDESTGLPSLSKKNIENVSVYITQCEEQAKIGQLIKKLDSLIDLQQRKLAQLKLLKKAMLQQLFASQNQVFPITRFKNFDGDWEQRKFEQFIEVEKKKNKSGFSYDPYSISNVDGFVPQNEQFGEGNTYSKTDKKSNYIVEPHSFAYNPARINVGSIGYQHFEKSVLVSSLYEIFKTKNDINDYFLWYWFHTRSFTDQVMKYQEGGVRQYYFIDKLKISKIKIPTFREQKLIAEFLRLLEINITLQQNKLTHLNKLKKFLLQKMFM